MLLDTPPKIETYQQPQQSDPQSLLPAPSQRVSTPIAQLDQQPIQPQQRIVRAQPQQQQQATVKRRDMLKIVTYSLIILFALAVYSCAEMIIKEAVVGGDLSSKQELGIRVIYPLLIFVGLWNVKLFV